MLRRVDLECVGPEAMAGERKRRVGEGRDELERVGRTLHAGERS